MYFLTLIFIFFDAHEPQKQIYGDQKNKRSSKQITLFFDAQVSFFLTLIRPFVTLNGLWGTLRLGRTADGGTGPGTAALKPRHRGAAAGGSARTEPYKHGDTLPQPHIFIFC